MTDSMPRALISNVNVPVRTKLSMRRWSKRSAAGRGLGEKEGGEGVRIFSEPFALTTYFTYFTQSSLGSTCFFTPRIGSSLTHHAPVKGLAISLTIK